MRADFEKRHAELEQKSVERPPKTPEDDAVAAVTLAGYCLDAAEWAVVRAEQTGGEADELAATRS
ncbi:hypothetical protein [Mycobacterium sp.]|uniref:hypothetical protein n=1 Tax=Mycobacterium sp. TaxID=1785 RepID=UPI003F9486FB